MIGHRIDHFYVDLSGAPASFIFMTKGRQCAPRAQGLSGAATVEKSRNPASWTVQIRSMGGKHTTA